MKTKETNPLQELRERQKRERKEMRAELAIVAALPPGIPRPTISNIQLKDDPRNDGVFAWLSWSIPYEHQRNGIAWSLGVFQALESISAQPVQATLCKWDNYRPSVSPGGQNDHPSEKPDWGHRTKKLTDSWPIAPLWVSPCQHTGNEARCFYRIDGKIFKVSVDIPLPVRLSCRRVEFPGGWRFDGPAQLHFPQHWHDIHDKNGQSVAQIDKNTRAFRDTDQGISGAMYWAPTGTQDDFPMTPAQFLAAIIAEKAPSTH